MEILKDRAPVHKTMRPIEHGIVKDKAKKKTDGQVDERVLEGVPVDAGHPGLVHFKEPCAHDRENKN